MEIYVNVNYFKSKAKNEIFFKKLNGLNADFYHTTLLYFEHVYNRRNSSILNPIRGYHHMAHITAYLRVSQGDQDVENQKFGILEYANRLKLSGIDFVEDVITSRVNWRERKIGEIVNSMKNGDILLVAETTRLGRSALEVLEIQKEMIEKGAILHIVKENIVVGNSGQTEIERIIQKTMLSLLGNMGEMERAFISKRTKEALEKKKAEGVKLGRPVGVDTVRILDQHYKQIFDLMKKGVSVPQILKIIAAEGEKPVTPQTFYSWIEKWGIKPIGFLSKANDAAIRQYFAQIDAARPKIKTFLEKHEEKRAT